MKTLAPLLIALLFLAGCKKDPVCPGITLTPSAYPLSYKSGMIWIANQSLQRISVQSITISSVNSGYSDTFTVAVNAHDSIPLIPLNNPQGTVNVWVYYSSLCASQPSTVTGHSQSFIKLTP